MFWCLYPGEYPEHFTIFSPLGFEGDMALPDRDSEDLPIIVIRGGHIRGCKMPAHTLVA